LKQTPPLKNNPDSYRPDAPKWRKLQQEKCLSTAIGSCCQTISALRFECFGHFRPAEVVFPAMAPAGLKEDTMLAAVILSGGSSSRMGSPKALLPYQGRPFLEHLLAVSKHPRIGTRRVVLGAHAEPIARVVDLDAHEIVINDEWEKGQLSSIQAAIRSLPPGTDGMLLFLIDHPLITQTLVSDLIEHFYDTGAPVVLPVFQGKRGHPVIFSAELYKELENAPVDQGARSVVWAHNRQIGEHPTTEEGCILNLNDPKAFERVEG
jgi:molybdenum cofactor cytidylyltransferase